MSGQPAASSQQDGLQPLRPFGRDLEPHNDFVPFREEEMRQSVARRFELQVAASPARMAVRSDGRAFTYDALNRAANRAAQAILARRGERLEPVALCLEHGVSAIVGALATLKAGKFYVPMDPSLPRERAGHVLDDSQAGLLLVGGRTATAALNWAPADFPMLNIDELDSGLSEENPGCGRSPDDPAMILYTSGSTGQPKGVLRTHACTLRSAMQDINSFHLCAEDRESLLAKFSFGASVSNAFGVLLSGALLLPFDVAKDGFVALARWLVEEQITILKATPTVFRNLARVLGEEPLPAIRILALGSETIQPSDVELFKKCCPADSLLRIVFSATELGSYATRIFLDRNTDLRGNVVPAGYPSEGVEIALVDEDGNEVQPGQVGEIVVKSAHMALGYWRRPDLTDKVFAADPRGNGLRIYRTGDVGRMLPDGCLVHLGRRDHQVKVRGNRIETAEIEKALLAVSGFSNVAVMARDDGAGDKRLVAYLVAEAKAPPTVSRLKAQLSEKLPAYMVPSVFVFMSQLPMTAGGKVDRAALPEPDGKRPVLDAAYVEPRTPVEEMLAAIWAKMLRVSPVGVNDNFFDLGGHSLLAVAVISRVHTECGAALTPQEFFEAPTIANLSLVIAQRMAEMESSEDVARVLERLEHPNNGSGPNPPDRNVD
jgi:amino acid adenylation domain-containing protein